MLSIEFLRPVQTFALVPLKETDINAITVRIDQTRSIRPGRGLGSRERILILARFCTKVHTQDVGNYCNFLPRPPLRPAALRPVRLT